MGRISPKNHFENPWRFSAVQVRAGRIRRKPSDVEEEKQDRKL